MLNRADKHISKKKSKKSSGKTKKKISKPKTPPQKQQPQKKPSTNSTPDNKAKKKPETNQNDQKPKHAKDETRNFLPGQKHPTPDDVRNKKNNKLFQFSLFRVMEPELFMKVYMNKNLRVKWQKSGV